MHGGGEGRTAGPCYAALHKDALSRAGIGSETRSTNQLMADTLTERLTGQTKATNVPVQVNVIMTDQILLSYGTNKGQPATIIGGGVIPADLARHAIDASPTQTTNGHDIETTTPTGHTYRSRAPAAA